MAHGPAETAEALVSAAAAATARAKELGRGRWHVLEDTARERGSRLVATGVLDRPDDVLYLTLDQILEPPGDAAAVVARRRDERTRLAGIDMPPRFSGTWEPAGPSEAAAGGATLSGIGVSPGRAQGRVRVIGPAADDDFDPGDVLVAHVTDVGHTALFAAAAAVITDIGGMMSHAAVVAREFGIPAVVGVDRASHRLTDGQIVEVDGRAGTVTVLSV